MMDDVLKIVEIAEEDLEEAKNALERGKYRISCFFAQQSAEKFLKAFLLKIKEEYPFEHSLTYLIKLCKDVDDDFEALFKMKAPKLGKYYTGTRYLPLLDVSEDEAREAVDIAEKIRKFILKKL